MIYSYKLQAAGFDAGTIHGLPVPSYDDRGIVNDEYWQELGSLIVPSTVLDFMSPSIRSAGGAETRMTPARGCTWALTMFACLLGRLPGL